MTTHEDGLGGSITILEHGSSTTPMRFRMVLPKGFAPPAPECHPAQSEDYKILRGTLDLGIIGGKHVLLHAGDSYHMPANTYHLPHNPADSELEFEAVLTPGFESSAMFHDLYFVLREYRGLGKFARISFVCRRYTRVDAVQSPGARRDDRRRRGGSHVRRRRRIAGQGTAERAMTTDITTFHAHVYFDPATSSAAATLRDKVAASFAVTIGRFHDRPIGPHPKGTFEICFALDQLGPLVAWLMLHRDGLSVLVHPLSGDPLADHTTYPMWLGEQVQLDLEVIRRARGFRFRSARHSCIGNMMINAA